MNRTVLQNSQVAGLRWSQVIAIACHPVDHIHGVIEIDGDQHIIHLDPLGEPNGPQTLMAERWEPDSFDSISLDEEH